PAAEARRGLPPVPATRAALWRQKQLEYTWLRALMGTYVDFWAVTEAALRHTLRRLGLAPPAAEVQRLMDAYLSLACFPEVGAALERLAGRPRAVLSNGSPAMLAAAVASSGLAKYLDHVLSVDAVRTYKPSPLVDAPGPRRSGRRWGRGGSAFRRASCSLCPRTPGMSPARRRLATRPRGATGPTRPRWMCALQAVAGLGPRRPRRASGLRSWACDPTSWCARSISFHADAERRKQHGRLARATRP